MKKAFIKALNISILTLILSFCTAQTKNEHFIDLDNDKLEILEAELKEQRTTIEKLQAQLDALTIEKIANSENQKLKKTSKLPMSKKKEIKSLLDIKTEKSDNFTEGEVISDSENEEMHWYYQGLRQLQGGQFEEAISSFREFLREKPDHVYADRAEYLISRAHFLNKDYQLVIVTTNLLESRYPYSVKLSDAIYERALAYEMLGEKKYAIETLKNLLNKYPNSSLSEKVSRKLAELSSGEKSAIYKNNMSN